MAQLRIRSEHCIGILKGRFGCLKRNNIALKKGKREVKHLVEMIGSCIVLHNLLIDYDEHDVPSDWYDEIKNSIDWSLYDEEQEGITDINNDEISRRDYMFNSIINNYI